MKRKPQEFKHVLANVGGKEYVLPMNPSDEAVRGALVRIISAAEQSKRTVHNRMMLADDILRIVAKELNEGE